MDNFIKIYFVILLLCCGLIKIIKSQQCSKSAIDVCVQPLKKYNIESSAMFPQLNKVELTALCNDYSKVESCLLPVKPTCDLFQRRHYEGIELAYNYICGEGFAIYGRNYDCFGLDEARNKVKACNTSFQQRAVNIEGEAQYMAADDIQTENCKRMNDYLFCIRDEIAGVCGNEAGDWQQEVNKRSISPVLNEINCQIGRPALNGGEIAGIVIGCIIALILITVLIFYFTCNVQMYKKKKLKYASEQNKVRNGSTPAPPIVPRLDLPQSSRELPSAPPKGSFRSIHSSRSTLKLNLSFADDHGSNISYDTLPPSYTKALENMKHDSASNYSNTVTDLNGAVPDTRLKMH